MAEYRFIKPRIWSDPYFYNLTNDERLAFIWLFTNERTTTSGIYPLLPPVMAAELKIAVEEAEKILQKFEQDGKILYRDGYVWVKNFLRHQIGNAIKDNRFKKVFKEIEQAPLSIKNEFLSYYSDIFEAPLKPLQSPSKAPPKEFQNKEKDKEKEKNKEKREKKEEKEKKEIYKERKEKEETLLTSLPEDIIQFKEFFNTTIPEDIRNSILDSLRNIFRKKSFRSARQLEMLKAIFEEEGFDARAVDTALQHIVKIKKHHWLFNYGPPAYDRFVKSWNELKHFKPFIVKPEDIPDGFPSKEALFDFLDKFCENDKQVREVIKVMKYHKGMEDAWQMYEEYKRRQV